MSARKTDCREGKRIGAYKVCSEVSAPIPADAFIFYKFMSMIIEWNLLRIIIAVINIISAVIYDNWQNNEDKRSESQQESGQIFFFPF